MNSSDSHPTPRHGPVPPAAGARLVLSVEEAGRLLGISRALAYELVARHELPHLRLGRRIVVSRKALEAMLAAASEREGGLRAQR